MRITATVCVNRPPSELFTLSQDYHRRLEWDNYLSEAHLLGGADKARVGIEVFCRSKSGQAMTSRYISYKPPQVAAVSMTIGPWVMQTFSGSWLFKENASGGTLVSFVYHFKTRPHLLRAVVEPLVAAIYARQTKSRLAAFKHWAETAISSMD